MWIFTGQIDVNAIQSYINTDVLPKIGQWLVMTKDYLYELWGRYIHYRISMFIFWLAICLWVIIAGLKLAKSAVKKEIKDYYDDNDVYTAKLCVWYWLAIIWWIVFIILIVELMWRIMIPEIKMYQSFTYWA